MMELLRGSRGLGGGEREGEKRRERWRRERWRERDGERERW